MPSFAQTNIEVSCVMPAVVKTELGSGLPETRAIKPIEPEDVADAIVAALERPKFDVWVPRESAAISKVLNLLPRGGREGIARLLKADKVLAEADTRVRAAYEDRAAHSEPALDEPRDERDTERERDGGALGAFATARGREAARSWLGLGREVVKSGVIE